MAGQLKKNQQSKTTGASIANHSKVKHTCVMTIIVCSK
jgi:hypothetical protein